MSIVTRQFGLHGETVACNYLKKHNYTIVERNFRARAGEIDIIAVDHSESEATLAFIEVKTRVSVAFGDPLEAIGYYKLQSLRKTVEYYLLNHKNIPQRIRIDAVGILMSEDGVVEKITLVKNIS